MSNVLTIEKLENILGAETDRVYRMSSRGEEFLTAMGWQLLATMKREKKLLDCIRLNRRVTQEFANDGCAANWKAWQESEKGIERLLAQYASEYSESEK